MSRIELVQNRSGYIKHGQDHILVPSLRRSPTTGGITFEFRDPGKYSRKFTVSGADVQKIQSGEIRKVGVNCYRVEEDERTVELHPYDENATAKQSQRVRKIRTERSQNDLEHCLDEVRKAAQSRDNLMPPIINAVKVYATLGEITNVMKEVFGEFEEPVGF